MHALMYARFRIAGHGFTRERGSEGARTRGRAWRKGQGSHLQGSVAADEEKEPEGQLPEAPEEEAEADPEEEDCDAGTLDAQEERSTHGSLHP